MIRMWWRRLAEKSMIQQECDGRWRACFQMGSPGCYGLESAPPEMEKMLRTGWWFIMLAAVWSGPDRMAISTATEVAHELEGQVHVAVRPFNLHSETESWLPMLKVDSVSPIWVLLQEGELVAWEFGIRPKGNLLDWVHSHRAPKSR